MTIEDVLRQMRDPSADNERLLWADAVEAEIARLTGTLDRLRIAYAELEKEKDAEIDRLQKDAERLQKENGRLREALTNMKSFYSFTSHVSAGEQYVHDKAEAALAATEPKT